MLELDENRKDTGSYFVTTCSVPNKVKTAILEDLNKQVARTRGLSLPIFFLIMMGGFVYFYESMSIGLIILFSIFLTLNFLVVIKQFFLQDKPTPKEIIQIVENTDVAEKHELKISNEYFAINEANVLMVIAGLEDNKFFCRITYDVQPDAMEFAIYEAMENNKFYDHWIWWEFQNVEFPLYSEMQGNETTPHFTYDVNESPIDFPLVFDVEQNANKVNKYVYEKSFSEMTKD